jgi:hypothetical protein
VGSALFETVQLEGQPVHHDVGAFWLVRHSFFDDFSGMDEAI